MLENDPIVLVDVGARGGLNMKWKPLEDVTRVIGFEPDAEECRRLNAQAHVNESFLPVALSNTRGNITLNITRNTDCCSTLKPEYTLINRFSDAGDFQLSGSSEIPCDTLDNIVTDRNIGNIDFLKIDTQGSERQVLQGAEKTLSQCGVFGIEIEAEFSPLYEGQSLFSDVDVLLREKGYTLFDIRTPPGRKVRKTAPAGSRQWSGQTLWTDFLYFRDYAAEANTLPDEFTTNRAIKTIAISECLGFGDFSLELLDLYVGKGIMPEKDKTAIRDLVLTAGSNGLRPEVRLYENIKRTAGEYLQTRLPFLHRKYVNSISKNGDGTT